MNVEGRSNCSGSKVLRVRLFRRELYRTIVINMVHQFVRNWLKLVRTSVVYRSPLRSSTAVDPKSTKSIAFGTEYCSWIIQSPPRTAAESRAAEIAGAGATLIRALLSIVLHATSRFHTSFREHLRGI